MSPPPGKLVGGGEDPRLIKMGDWYYLTYAARPYPPGRYWDPVALNNRYWINPPPEGPMFLKENGTLTHLAITQDFVNFKRLGRITDTRDDDPDVILFPEKIIARTKQPILEPTEACERSGIYKGCVFPTGNVIHEGMLYVYYGAADKYVCVATAALDAFLNDLVAE